LRSKTSSTAVVSTDPTRDDRRTWWHSSDAVRQHAREMLWGNAVAPRGRTSSSPARASRAWVAHARRAIAKVVISGFAVLNLTTVLWANRPAWAVRMGDELRNAASARNAYRVAYAGWLLSRYAHLAGLDNRWQMFGRQSRFNWWFQIQAVDAEGTPTDLPLPLQSDRTVVERTFFDFREAKFNLNLYGIEDLRIRYGRYLCRHFPVVKGNLVRRIRITRHHRMLLPMQVARSRGTHLEPQSYATVINELSCSVR
jgi:hypothetical protein